MRRELSQQGRRPKSSQYARHEALLGEAIEDNLKFQKLWGSLWRQEKGGDPWGVMYRYVTLRTIGDSLRSGEEKP